MKQEKVEEWKKYLRSKSIKIDSERDFAKAMRGIDKLIASHASSTKGMIWRNGQINPRASIADVDASLRLLSKFAQATLDDLGSPSEENRLSGTPLNSMFISQDDSGSDEWNPGNSQNQGTEGSTVPKTDLSGNKKNNQKVYNIDERMKSLTDFMEKIKK